MNESYHSSRTTQKPKKVPLVKSIVARAKNRTPWTVQACVEACACDRTPDTTRTESCMQTGQNSVHLKPIQAKILLLSSLRKLVAS